MPPVPAAPMLCSVRQCVCEVCNKLSRGCVMKIIAGGWGDVVQLACWRGGGGGGVGNEDWDKD